MTCYHRKSKAPSESRNNEFTKNFTLYFDRYVSKDDKLALLLDFDGTLSQLAPHPDLAVFEPDSETALKHLSTYPNVYLAIISGRGADNAREKVKLDKITYAGNHGLEIVFSNKSRYTHELSKDTRINFEKMVAELETSVSYCLLLANDLHTLRN